MLNTHLSHRLTSRVSPGPVERWYLSHPFGVARESVISFSVQISHSHSVLLVIPIFTLPIICQAHVSDTSTHSSPYFGQFTSLIF